MNRMKDVIIHPSIEPGVIDNAAIIHSVLEQGPTEEAGRLFAEEGVHIDETEVLRLEFKNILRIDHLWMLRRLTKLCLAHNLIETIKNLDDLGPTLIELDLSFNKIEVIENLEALVNLEVLTLCHNKIRKLENMETLEKLLIFSIADNLIEDFKEVAYLRQFRCLRSFSFGGNLCCDDPMADMFCKSALWQITYYNFRKVTEEEREEGGTLFRGALRKLDEADEISEKARLEKEEYDAQVELYALSFVEYLSGPELFDKMFAGDPDGLLCLQCGGELLEYYEQYKEQYVEFMSELVEFAQGQYAVREDEVKQFKVIVDTALNDSVRKCHSMLDEFYEEKAPLMKQLNKMISDFNEKHGTLEELEPKLVVLTEKFHNLLHELWKKLMKEEITLFEAAEETRVQFGVNLTELVNKLLEVARNSFGLWRESECNWTIRQSEILTKFLGETGLWGDVTEEFMEMLSDRDILMNTVAASTDNHLRFIDDREDLLTRRSTTWRDDLINDTNDNEIKRNRSRILEINYFLDNQRTEWTELQLSLAEPPPDAETAALLGEDF